MSQDVEIELLVPSQGSPGIKGVKGDEGDPGDDGTPGAGYGGSSASSLAIGIGSKAFATQSGLAYLPGTRVRIASASDPVNKWMEGVVSTYVANTLTVAVSRINGAGTFTDWRISVTGDVQTLSGGGAISISYTFSTTTTDSDPGNGNLRLNNATQNAATVIRADLADVAGSDWSAVLGLLADSTSTLKGFIRLFKITDPTKFLVFSISALASPVGYKNITAAVVGYSDANPFANGDAITLSFTRNGDMGATGADGTPVGGVLGTLDNSPPTGYYELDGSAILRSTTLGGKIFKSATVTISIASPGEVTWTAHGLSANDRIRLKTTGNVPTGYLVNTDLFVCATGLTANVFRLSLAPGGAAITTSGTQSGVHTAEWALAGYGDGSTTTNLPDMRGEFPRGWDHGRGIDVSRCRGQLQLDALQGFKVQVSSPSNDGILGDTGTGTATFYYSMAGATLLSSGPVTDGTNGTPRVAAETRPRNLAIMWCVKF